MKKKQTEEVELHKHSNWKPTKASYKSEINEKQITFSCVEQLGYEWYMVVSSAWSSWISEHLSFLKKGFLDQYHFQGEDSKYS